MWAPEKGNRASPDVLEIWNLVRGLVVGRGVCWMEGM